MNRLILSNPLLDITLNRLCQQLIENHGDFSNSVILGLQPRGIYLAERIAKKLREETNIDIKLGHLDATFFRDDSGDVVEQPRAVYGFNQHEHTAIFAPFVHNHALQQPA